MLLIFKMLYYFGSGQNLGRSSSVRSRRGVADDFDNARRDFEELLNDGKCSVDGDCTGSPIVECDHDGTMQGSPIGKCRFTWWFILILAVIALGIIGGILSCLCSPCCCLYECMRKLCCCCC